MPPFKALEDGCYLYSDGIFVVLYDDANNLCHNHGRYLAMIKSGDENRVVIENYLTPNSGYQIQVSQPAACDVQAKCLVL